MGSGFAKFATGVSSFAQGALQNAPQVFNAVKMGAASGGPEGALAAGLGVGIPALLGTVSDTVNAVKNPNGPQSIQELGQHIGQGAMNLGSQLINSNFLKGQVGNAKQVLSGTISNLAAGQSFGAAFSGAGGNKFGQNFANAAATALSNKAGGMVGANPSTIMGLGNGLLRGAMMSSKASVHRNGIDNQVLGHARALAGQIVGGVIGRSMGGGGGGTPAPSSSSSGPNVALSLMGPGPAQQQQDLRNATGSMTIPAGGVPVANISRSATVGY